MKKVIVFFITYITFCFICFAQTNKIYHTSKNHSNIEGRTEILDQSIKNLASEKNLPLINQNENQELDVAETTIDFIILSESIKNIFRDEELKKLICCESTTQNQLSKDKFLVDSTSDLFKHLD